MKVNRIFLSASEGWLAPVLVRVPPLKWHTEKEPAYYEELAHRFMVPGKCPNLQGWVSEVETQESLIFISPSPWEAENQESWLCSCCPKVDWVKIQGEPVYRVCRQEKSWCHTLKAKRIPFTYSEKDWPFLPCSATNRLAEATPEEAVCFTQSVC